MKKILLVILILSSVSCFSQRLTKEQRQAILDAKKNGEEYIPPPVNTDTLQYPVRYCLLMGTSKLFSNKVTITIDYGQNLSFFENTQIRDDNGTVLTFNSVIDALNYMNNLGWEFVQAYVITVGNQNVYHYLLKAGPNLKDNFIPKTKRDFKKND